MFTPNSCAEFLYYKNLHAAPVENVTRLPGFKRWQKLKKSTSWARAAWTDLNLLNEPAVTGGSIKLRLERSGTLGQ